MESVMSKVSIPGVAVGGVVDILASNALSVPLAVYLASKINLNQVPENQIPDQMLGLLHANPGLYALQLLIGVACTVLGGYVAALIARREQVLNGALASFLCVAFGVYAIVSGKSADPTAIQVSLIVLSPILGAAGGWLRLKQWQRGGYAPGRHSHA
jgi:hypothetical protein